MNTNFKLDLPDRRRRRVRAQLRRRHGLHQRPRRLSSSECPNVGKLLQNLGFTLPMESQVMGGILDDGKEPDAAADRMAEGQPGAARGLARRRHHRRRRRRRSPR